MFGAAFAFATLILANAGAMASEPRELLDRSAHTMEHMKVDSAFERARNMMKDAKAVLVVPSLIKCGFIFGAEGFTRHGSDEWNTAFYGEQ